MGRWAETFIPQTTYYYGADYSAEMIELARKRNVFPQKKYDFECYSFQQLTDLPEEKFPEKFDRVVICGVCMYINDQELQECFEKLNRLLAKECIIYLTETVARESRLTLDGFYSETLKADYDSIYRTQDEYNQLYYPLTTAGFQIEKQGFLPKLNKEEKYSETDRWYSILKRM